MKKLIPVLTVLALLSSNLALAKEAPKPSAGTGALGGCAAFGLIMGMAAHEFMGGGVKTAVGMGCAGGLLAGGVMGAAMADEAPLAQEELKAEESVPSEE